MLWEKKLFPKENFLEKWKKSEVGEKYQIYMHKNVKCLKAAALFPSRLTRERTFATKAPITYNRNKILTKGTPKVMLYANI